MSAVLVLQRPGRHPRLRSTESLRLRMHEAAERDSKAASTVPPRMLFAQGPAAVGTDSTNAEQR